MFQVVPVAEPAAPAAELAEPVADVAMPAAIVTEMFRLRLELAVARRRLKRVEQAVWVAEQVFRKLYLTIAIGSSVFFKHTGRWAWMVVRALGVGVTIHIYQPWP